MPPPGLGANRYAALRSDSSQEEEAQEDAAPPPAEPPAAGDGKRKRDAEGEEEVAGGGGGADEAREAGAKRRKKRRAPGAQAEAGAEAESKPAAEAGAEAKAEGKPAAESSTDAKASSSSALAAGEVRTLPGGVKVEVLRAAPAGATVAVKGSVVRLIYEGKLEKEGKKFDAGEIDFLLGDGKMIRGVDAGVLGMAVGEQRRLHVPARMGYGKKGKRPKVPPHADLVFDVALTHAGVDWCQPGQAPAVSAKRREAIRRRGKKPRQP